MHRDAAISFLFTFNAQIAPNLVSILARSSRDDAAARTIRVVESIFTSSAIGVDGQWFLLDGEASMTEEARAVLIRIFQARCIHPAAVLEMCEAAVASMLTPCARGLDLSLYPSLVAMPSLFPVEAAHRVAACISCNLADIYVLAEEKGEVMTALPILVATLLFLPFSPDTFLPHCIAFVRALPMVIKIEIVDGNRFLSLAIGIWLRILKCLLTARPNALPYEDVEIMRASVFPGLLKVRCIVDSAVSLSISLPNGMQNLFEYIGYYQDEALLENSGIVGIVHYIELINSVVTENAKEVRNHYRTLCTQRIDIARKNTEASTNIRVAEARESMHVIFEIEPESCDDESPAAAMEIIDENSHQRQSYMQDAIIQEDCHKLEKHALHDSVFGTSSFLGCFVPFLAAIAGAESIHPVLRVAVLRALGKYLVCSSQLLQTHSPLLTSIMFQSHVYDDAHPMLPVVLQALHTWYTAYKPGVSDATDLLSVVSLICAGEAHSKACASKPLIILRCAVDMLSSMIIGGMIKVPEQYGFFIALSLHWSCIRKYEELYERIKMRLASLCLCDAKLLSRVVFYVIKCNAEEEGKDAFYVSHQTRLSICRTLVVSLLHDTSPECVHQVNAIGENLIKEILVTGDRTLLPYAHHFPLTKASRTMLAEAVHMANSGGSSIPTRAAVGAVLASDVLQDLLEKPNETSDDSDSSVTSRTSNIKAGLPRPVLKRARVVYSSDSE